MENQPSKMNIEKEAQELKFYMFTVQGGPIKIDLPKDFIKIDLPEDFKVVMAYNDTDAINMVRKDYPAGLALFVKKRAQVEVRKIIDVVNLRPETLKDLKIYATPPVPREKTMQDFVYGMMLIADKFVENKRDQASLKRIINKIRINHAEADKTTTATKL